MFKIRTVFLGVALLVALVADASASDLVFKDIAGKWCGSAANYTFTRNELTVSFNDRRTPARHFKITDYYYKSDTITIDWINAKGEKVHTDFAEFTDDGTMAQQKNEVGPRRPFHRC